jgi:hypothetical protein
MKQEKLEWCVVGLVMTCMLMIAGLLIGGSHYIAAMNGVVELQKQLLSSQQMNENVKGQLADVNLKKLVLESAHAKAIEDLKIAHKTEIASTEKEVATVKSQSLDDVLERIHVITNYAEKNESERKDAWEKKLTDAGACQNQQEEMKMITDIALERITTAQGETDRFVKEAMTCGKQRRELKAENEKLKGAKP